MSVPDLPADCVFQLFVPESGYRLRVWSDGHSTRGGETLVPFATVLQYPQGRARFAEQVARSWGQALAAVDGQHLGPFVEDGARLPNQQTLKLQALVFRARDDGKVVEATVQGDLRLSSSLGPLQDPWETLSKQLFPPNR